MYSFLRVALPKPGGTLIPTFNSSLDNFSVVQLSGLSESYGLRECDLVRFAFSIFTKQVFQ